MDGRVFNSEGQHVADIRVNEIYDLSGRKLYEPPRSKDLQTDGRAPWTSKLARFGQTARQIDRQIVSKSMNWAVVKMSLG